MAVGMQLHILAPIVLFPLARSRKAAIGVGATTLVAHFVYVVFAFYHYDLKEIRLEFLHCEVLRQYSGYSHKYEYFVHEALDPISSFSH